MQETTSDGVQRAYDTVAVAYSSALFDELDDKPLDRALLTAFAELCGDGVIADVGCGPGQVTAFLGDVHRDVVGVDLSPAFVELAAAKNPGVEFTVASMLDLPVADHAWAGALAFYSVIHLTPADRALAFLELARVIRPGGCLFVAFHVEREQSQLHLTTWMGSPVDLVFNYLDPTVVTAEIQAARFEVLSTTVREPNATEHRSRRCYLLARRY